MTQHTGEKAHLNSLPWRLASWFSKCGHCKAVWNKTPSHFTTAATVLQIQLCGAGRIPNTSFLCLLLAQEPAQIASVNSSQLQWKIRAYDKSAHMLMTHAPCTSYLWFYILFVTVNKFLFCENCDVFVLFKKLIWNTLFLYLHFLPNSVKCG